MYTFANEAGDNGSVGSHSLWHITSSFRSTRTAKSSRSLRSDCSEEQQLAERGMEYQLILTLPFDRQGYCGAHHGAMLAKKTARSQAGEWTRKRHVWPARPDAEFLAVYAHGVDCRVFWT